MWVRNQQSSLFGHILLSKYSHLLNRHCYIALHNIVVLKKITYPQAKMHLYISTIGIQSENVEESNVRFQ